MSAANIRSVQQLYAIHANADFDGVLDQCSPDIEWCSGGSSEDFPAFGPRKGRAAVRAFFDTVSEALEFSEFTPLEFYADKDKVFVLGAYTFRMKTGGAKVTSDWVHIFTMRGDKVVAFREFLDTARVAQAYRA
jgi:uncharacterized protein